MANTDASPSPSEFAEMFENSIGTTGLQEGRVLAATVTGIENDCLVLDIGLKTEGRVPIREFQRDNKDIPAMGDLVEVYLERIENALGDAVLSREKARREEAWNQLETQFRDKETITGSISGRVKGGFTVDLSGVSAFLPGSQVDIRPIRDVSALMEQPQPFAILKIDRPRGNIVVSRRAVLEESRAEQRAEIVGNMVEGEKRRGVIKNVTDYGVFVDLGGIDGLLHVTDMSWKRIPHPSQLVDVGQEVEVQIIRINPETQRISLGMKQLTEDPWKNVTDKYPPQTKLTGRITNITEYGAFVELENGVEGLIHVSEMSWTKKNVHPGKIVSTSQEVEIMVLEVDPEKRRISLGLKQTLPNPWENFTDTHKAGSEIEGPIRGITEFGLFIALSDDLDGMVHINDLDWHRPGEKAILDYKKGDVVQAKVLDIDTNKERISLGIKQLTEDPMKQSEVRKNKIVTCTVKEIHTGGILVGFGAEDAESEGFIRKSELSVDRAEQRSERFAIGDKLDAMIIQIDKAARKITLSVKALEIQEEKEAVAQYGSVDSGASLGDILGAALASETDANTDSEEPAPIEEDSPPQTDTAEADAPASTDSKATSDDTDTAPDPDTAPIEEPKPAKKVAAKKAAPKTKAASKTKKKPASSSSKKADSDTVPVTDDGKTD